MCDNYMIHHEMATNEEATPLIGTSSRQRSKMNQLEHPIAASANNVSNLVNFPTDLCNQRSCLIFGLVIFSLSLCALIALAAVSVSEYKYCEDVHRPSADHKYTRSGSNILLTKTNTKNFDFVVPVINAELSGEASITIYETRCKDLHTQKDPVSRKSLTYENVLRPIVVLSEDFDENYFLNGTVDVVVNATFNTSLSGTDVYVCLFVDYKAFMDFTNSDRVWRMYLKSATCRRTSDEQFNTTFNVANPNYVFIALATTNALDTLQFGYNGTRYGYDIPTFTNNIMTELCILRSDKPGSSACTFSVSDTDSESDDGFCLLAANGVNADSSYDYSTIKQHNVVNHNVVNPRRMLRRVTIVVLCVCVFLLLFRY